MVGLSDLGGLFQPLMILWSCEGNPRLCSSSKAFMSSQLWTFIDVNYPSAHECLAISTLLGNSEVSSLPWGCARSASCVCCLRWFHSKWHLSMGKRRILQTNGLLFQHLHGRDPRNGFHQQNSLWVPLTATASSQGMLRWKSKECHSSLEPIPSVSNRQPKKTH